MRSINYFFRYCIALIFLMLVIGCTSAKPQNSDTQFPSLGNNLPEPDISVEIKGLSYCTETDDKILNLNSREALFVLVHGCKGSVAKFRALADVFAFHGQQAICFTYDDRDSLMKSSSDLIQSLNTLLKYMPKNHITLIGHSQGGLIARKALIKERADVLQGKDLGDIQLITISSPFAGIKAAKHCGSKMHRNLTLGLSIPICKLISGEKWFEITSASDFIQKPGSFIHSVSRHLKIITDERDSCRQYAANGGCLKEDFVFSLEEQCHPLIDADKMMISYEIIAGHAEIVGDEQIQPQKLINLFQAQGIMPQTPLERKEELALLLDQLF